MWGNKETPTYEEVCGKKTWHAEAIEITFDPDKVSYEALAKLFFEIHDATQIDRQWPDIGEQYRSAIFYVDQGQKAIAEKLVNLLKKKWYKIATQITQATTFWEAEKYHQKYYEKSWKQPYCHVRKKLF